MYKAYKFSRIYPDTEQRIALAKNFGCCRLKVSQSLCIKNYATTIEKLSGWRIHVCLIIIPLFLT